MKYMNKNTTNGNRHPFDMDEEELEEVREYTGRLIDEIIGKAGDAVHLLQFRTTGTEPLSYFYAMNAGHLYSDMGYSILAAKVMAWVTMVQNFVITLESHSKLTHENMNAKDYEAAGAPDCIVSWLFLNRNIVSLTKDQTFDFYYSDKDEITERDLTFKVCFSDAWELNP